MEARFSLLVTSELQTDLQSLVEAIGGALIGSFIDTKWGFGLVADLDHNLEADQKDRYGLMEWVFGACGEYAGNDFQQNLVWGIGICMHYSY